MNIYIRSLIIVLFALTAAGSSCSKKDKPAVEMDAAATDKTVESTTETIGKASGDAINETANVGGEAMNATPDVIEEAEGEIGKIVGAAEGMANKAMGDVEGISEEVLEEKVKQQLGVSD